MEHLAGLANVQLLKETMQVTKLIIEIIKVDFSLLKAELILTLKF